MSSRRPTVIDTHAHLDLPEFDDDRGDVIRRARAAGVERIVCVGITRRSSESAIALADEHPMVVAAVGVHPNSAADAEPDDFSRIERLAEKPGVVAIGETGIDHYRDFCPVQVQRHWFDRHLALGRRCDLPVIIHCRDAEDDVLTAVRAAADSGPIRGVLHAFSGDGRFAAACLELGLYVSFAGMVTYTNRKFQSLREVAREIPADRLLIETDSPYLVPHPLRGRQKRNEPALVRLTAEALAELRGTTVEDLIAQTSDNARRLFRLTTD